MTWFFIAAVAVAIGAGLAYVGGSGTGPDHQCSITIYPDRTYKTDGWAMTEWPPRHCNWVVHAAPR